VFIALRHQPARIRAVSRDGAAPKKRAYSRLNCVALSYPTENAADVTLALPLTISLRASSRRIYF